MKFPRNPPPDFIVRAATPENYSQAGELVANAFSRGNPRAYERSLHNWLVTRPLEPGFDYDLHRLGLKDGQVVAHVGIKPATLHYGSARLHVGGVAAVCTHPDYRKQGYSSSVLQDALAFMTEQGAHLALLNGISNYYDRFGFSPVWPDYYLETDSATAAALEAPLKLRDVRPADIPAMAALYQKHWDGRVTFNRDPRLWAWRAASGARPYQQVVDDGRGGVCGYIAGHDLTDELIETLADTPEAALTILKAGGQARQHMGAKTLRWIVPPDDALVSFARQYLTVTVSARYLPNGGWMARLIDARGLVNTLLPEIVAQAASSDPTFDADALSVDPGGGGVQISLRKQPATLCNLNYYDFIQVVFGSLRPAALAVRPYSQLQPQGRQLLELLFPPRMAVLGCWDWF
jgi:predicted N-acetyltransferase YhbS